MGIAGVTGTVGLISLARFGWPVHAEYLDLLQFLSHRGESYVDNQTVNGFLNRMLFLGNNLEWDGSHSQSVLDTRVYLATLGSFLLMAAIAVFYRVRHAPGPLDLALAILIFTFASPMAYRHHAGISAAIFILLFFQYRTRRMARFDWFFLGVTFIFMANAFNGFNVFASTYLNFLQSNFLFAVAALIYQVMRAARWQSNPRYNAPLQTACVVP